MKFLDAVSLLRLTAPRAHLAQTESRRDAARPGTAAAGGRKTPSAAARPGSAVPAAQRKPALPPQVGFCAHLFMRQLCR